MTPSLLERLERLEQRLDGIEARLPSLIQFSEAIQYVVQTTIELGIGAALRRWNRDNDSTVSD